MGLGQILARAKQRLNRNLNIGHSPSAFGFEDIRPIGNSQGSSIANKAGRIVLRARHKGQTVKIYEAFSPEHAQFILAVSAKLPDLFPRVLEVRDAWIVTEWIEGQRLAEDIGYHQIKVLRRIHGVAVEGLPPAGFCYIKDFILPRCRRAMSLAAPQEKINFRCLEIDNGTTCTTVMHPDISPNNLVRTPEGEIKCIDNELLCFGSAPLLDFCNAVRNMPKDQRDEAAKKWLSVSSTTSQMIENTAKLWILREAGAAFTKGDFTHSSRMIADLERCAERWLPFPAHMARGSE